MKSAACCFTFLCHFRPCHYYSNTSLLSHCHLSSSDKNYLEAIKLRQLSVVGGWGTGESGDKKEAGEDGQHRVSASPISGQEFALLSFNRAGSQPSLQPQVSYYSIWFSLLPAFPPSTIRVPSSSWVGLCFTLYIQHSTLHIVDIQLHCELN